MELPGEIGAVVIVQEDYLWEDGLQRSEEHIYTRPFKEGDLGPNPPDIKGIQNALIPENIEKLQLENDSSSPSFSKFKILLVGCNPYISDVWDYECASPLEI